MENIKGRINLIVNLTEAKKALMNGHSAFWKGENGDQMCNVTCWVNTEPTKPGGKQDCGLQLNSKKDIQDPKTYIGGGKKTLEVVGAAQQLAPQQNQQAWPSAPVVDDLDLPF